MTRLVAKWILFFSFIFGSLYLFGQSFEDEKKYLDQRYQGFLDYKKRQEVLQKNRIINLNKYKRERQEYLNQREQSRQNFVQKRNSKKISSEREFSYEKEFELKRFKYLKKQKDFSKMQKKIRKIRNSSKKIDENKEYGL